MEDQKKKTDLHVIAYRDCFVPYSVADDDPKKPHDYEIKWAFFDPKSDENRDGTKLFAHAITQEVKETGKHITKERLDIYAKANDAQLLFTSEHPESISKLKSFLDSAAFKKCVTDGTCKDIDVKDFLAPYGFEGEMIHGFHVSKGNTPEIKKNSKTHSKKAPKATESDKEHEEKSAGSVPLSEKDYWDKNDARNLLIDAMTFTAQEVDENKKAIIKEFMGDIPTFVTTYLAPENLGRIGTVFATATLSGLLHQKISESKDLSKMKKIWASLQNDIADPAITPDEAHEILKTKMHKSGLLFEGAQKLEHDERRQYLKLINDECKFAGLFKDFSKISAHDVEKAGNSIRNMSANSIDFVSKKSKRAVEKMSLYTTHQKHNLKIAWDALKEMKTDLTQSREKHKEYDQTLWAATKITAKDTAKSLKSVFSNSESAPFSPVFCSKKAVPIICESGIIHVKKTPSTVTSYIDIDDASETLNILDDKKSRSSGKLSANANFLVTSGSIGFQIALTAMHAVNKDFGNTALMMLGLAASYGAYGQTAKNVVNVEAQVNSPRAEKAILSDFVIQMQSRMQENVEDQCVKAPESLEP